MLVQGVLVLLRGKFSCYLPFLSGLLIKTSPMLRSTSSIPIDPTLDDPVLAEDTGVQFLGVSEDFPGFTDEQLEEEPFNAENVLANSEFANSTSQVRSIDELRGMIAIFQIPSLTLFFSSSYPSVIDLSLPITRDQF